jgi:hypothetical protein
MGYESARSKYSDAWYPFFAVKPEDKLYLAEKDRVRGW